MEINFFKDGKIKFFKSESGILNIETEDKTYSNIKVISLFRASYPSGFVCVLDDKDEEIGIIEDLDELSAEQKDIVKKELKKHYIIPEIHDIFDVKGEYGIFEWDVNTDRGKRIFYVKGRNENIVVRNKKLIITDIDGCIYEIEDYTKLSLRSFVHLEKIL